MSILPVTVYSKPLCPSCDKAKALLTKMHIAFETIEIGKEIRPDELLQLFEDKGLPAPRTAPQVFISDQHIGGYEALQNYIENTGFNGTGVG